MPKEPLSIITVKTLLAVIIFTGIGTIIVGGGWLIGEHYKNKANDKIVKPVDQEMGDFTEDEENKKELVIIYPNKDTVWKAGESYQIRWTPVNLDPKLRIVIRLYEVPVVSLNLRWEPSYPIQNTGNYSFAVPEELKAGKYQFVIIGDGQTIRSDEFSIIQEEAEKEIKETVNLEKCFKIKNKFDRADCYEKVAKKTQDLSICDRIVKDFSSLDFMKQQCYVKIAKIKKDETICRGLWEIYSRDCYHDVAKIKKDSEICAKIKKSENLHIGKKDDCYVDIAIAKQDSEICEAIQNDIYKSWCSKTIQKQKLTPEEVTCGFLHNYIFREIYLNESDSVTEKYKQKIAEIKKVSVEKYGFINYDPVTYTQGNPDNGIIIEKATIQNDTASLCAILEYSGSGSYRLTVDLVMVDNQWKISDINPFEK